MPVRRALIALCLAVSPAALAAAPVPKEQLLKPPADADHFVVVSEAGKHGDEWRWTLPDGSIAYRESHPAARLVFETDQVVRFGADGMPVSIAIRGVTPSGDSAETFAIDRRQGALEKPGRRGQCRRPGRRCTARWRAPSSPTTRESPRLLAAGAGGRRPAAVRPRHARAVGQTLTMPRVRAGRRRSSSYFVEGHRPVAAAGVARRAGQAFRLRRRPRRCCRRAMKANLKAMIAGPGRGDRRAARRRSPSGFLTAEARQPVLFRNVKIYDADKERFVADQKVVVSDGKIASVGTAPVPSCAAGARGHRRHGQDAGSRPVGQPHAHRRRFQRAQRTSRSA